MVTEVLGWHLSRTMEMKDISWLLTWNTKTYCIWLYCDYTQFTVPSWITKQDCEKAMRISQNAKKKYQVDSVCLAYEGGQ
jgi:hypothetical protein